MGGVEDQLAEAQAELRALAAAAQEAESRAATGTAAQGWLRVTAVNGRITDVDIDSRAVAHLSPRELGSAFALAANEALDELAAASTLPGFPAMDPARLAQDLAEVQVQSERQMRAYIDLMTDALRRIR